MKHSKKHKRKSEAEIREILSLQGKQDITVTAFCKTHKIHKATFYNWRDKYGVKAARAEGFIPLQFAEPVAGLSTLFAEIELPSKVMVRLFQKVDAAYFKSLS
jgi:transposase-like protein